MPIQVLLFFIDTHLWPLLERRSCWDTAPTRVAHLISTMLCWKNAIGHQQVPICTRYKVLRSSNVSLARDHAKVYLSAQQLYMNNDQKINNNKNMHMCRNVPGIWRTILGFACLQEFCLMTISSRSGISLSFLQDRRGIDTQHCMTSP